MTYAQLLGSFDEAREACDAVLSPWVEAMDATLRDAIMGDRRAATSYASNYLSLAGFLSEHIARQPDERRWVSRVARREAVSLPFRACVVDNRLGLSVALALIGDLRRILPDHMELEWPGNCVPLRHLDPMVEVNDEGVRQFEHVVDRIVDGAHSPLEEVLETFGLSYTDAGGIFGVSRQAVTHWLAEGIPADRSATVTTAAQVASLLRHYLVPERIPGIARKRARRYGNRSMLGMIRDGDHDELLDITQSSFDWSRTA